MAVLESAVEPVSYMQVRDDNEGLLRHPVSLSVTQFTQRDEICFVIVAGSTSKPLVMDL